MNRATVSVLALLLLGLTFTAGVLLGPGLRPAPVSQTDPSPNSMGESGGMAGMGGMDPMDSAMSGMEGMSGSSGTAGGQMAGMNMGGASDGSIQLGPQDISNFGITFSTAAMRPLTRQVRAVGTVEFDETRMAYLAPKFGGWIETLHVSFEGETVRQGDPLAEVYSPAFVTAQEELLLAASLEAQVGRDGMSGASAGGGLVGAARRRLEYWDIDAEEIDRILETGTVRRTVTLHAPVSGVVMEKNVLEGQAFLPGQNLYMFADLSRVWVSAEVFESDAALVRSGMTADVAIAALPGRAFSGRIEYVYPTLADGTRSMRARVTLHNPGAVLKPGMFGTVRLAVEFGEVLSVPTSAVLHTGERQLAFVDMGGGQLMPHELSLGRAGDGFVEVLDGLASGHRVVTSPQFILDSESNLAEVMMAMMAQMGTSGGAGMDMDGMDMDMPGMDGGMGGMDGMEMSGDTANPVGGR